MKIFWLSFFSQFFLFHQEKTSWVSVAGQSRFLYAFFDISQWRAMVSLTNPSWGADVWGPTHIKTPKALVCQTPQHEIQTATIWCSCLTPHQALSMISKYLFQHFIDKIIFFCVFWLWKNMSLSPLMHQEESTAKHVSWQFGSTIAVLLNQHHCKSWVKLSLLLVPWYFIGWLKKCWYLWTRVVHWLDWHTAP